MTRRLIEYSAIITRMLASSCMMRRRTLSQAVRQPASAPATMAARGGGERVPAGDDQRRGHGAAEREAAVDRQVGEVDDAEREVDAERDQAEYQADLDRAERCDE